MITPEQIAMAEEMGEAIAKLEALLIKHASQGGTEATRTQWQSYTAGVAMVMSTRLKDWAIAQMKDVQQRGQL